MGNKQCSFLRTKLGGNCQGSMKKQKQKNKKQKRKQKTKQGIDIENVDV